MRSAKPPIYIHLAYLSLDHLANTFEIFCFSFGQRKSKELVGYPIWQRRQLRGLKASCISAVTASISIMTRDDLRFSQLIEIQIAIQSLASVGYSFHPLTQVSRH